MVRIIQWNSYFKLQKKAEKSIPPYLYLGMDVLIVFMLPQAGGRFRFIKRPLSHSRSAGPEACGWAIWFLVFRNW